MKPMGNNKTAEGAAYDYAQAKPSITIDGYTIPLRGWKGEILPHLNHSQWFYNADKVRASIDSTWCAYYLGNHKQLEIRESDIYEDGASIERRRRELTALRAWWRDEALASVLLEEWLAPWNYTDPVAIRLVSEATPNYGGVCRIWREPNTRNRWDLSYAEYVRRRNSDDRESLDIWQGTYTEAEAYIKKHYTPPLNRSVFPYHNAPKNGEIEPDHMMIIEAG